MNENDNIWWRIGTSGWNYKHWRGIFYPQNVPQSKWLEFYTEHFDTVEPSLQFDPLVAEDFFRLLKRDFRYALEARHKSWFQDQALKLMESHNIAFCISDTAGRYPYHEAITADFLYIRLHGSRKLYASCYSEEEIVQWAGKLRRWKVSGFIYFDNDFEGYAPKNALQLLEASRYGAYDI